HEQVEFLAPLLEKVSHFLFVLPESRGGTGGSPTSPRYAGLFNRPVVVVDDEDTYEQDGYYVYRSLDHIRLGDLSTMTPPACNWSPDAYVGELVRQTLAYWSK